MAENGGLTNPDNLYFMVPVKDANTGVHYFGIFDVNSFDDLYAPSYYAYRQEAVTPSRVPTVHTVVLEYRDLGVATITLTLTGYNDVGTKISVSTKVSLGTASANGAILTAIVGLTLTAFRPQLSFQRAAAGGPVSIVSATITGEVEEQSL